MKNSMKQVNGVREVLGTGQAAATRLEGTTAPDGTILAKDTGEPVSPPPLRTIDAGKQREADLKASAGYNHTPGLRHTLKADGATYDVGPNGAWHRITPRSCAKHHNLKNHSVARRARRGVV
jgi:hypothetical protein